MSKPNEDQWAADDAQTLRQFLTTHPKFLRMLVNRMPRSGTVKTTEEAANAGQKVEGYRDCLDVIEELQSGEVGKVKAAPFIQPTDAGARTL